MQGTAKMCSPGLAFSGTDISGFHCQAEQVCKAVFAELNMRGKKAEPKCGNKCPSADLQ